MKEIKTKQELRKTINDVLTNFYKNTGVNTTFIEIDWTIHFSKGEEDNAIITNIDFKMK